MIFLVGMPAAGKTYWGKRLSAAYNFEFIDLDEYIEQTYGQTIPDIFDKEGEESFRKKEQATLHKIISEHKTRTIVAGGGGTVAFYNNMQYMKMAGCVVYLQADKDLLLSRIAERNNRPLFQNETNPQQKLESLLLERRPYFEQAHYIIQVQNISVLNFEKIIQQCIERQ